MSTITTQGKCSSLCLGGRHYITSHSEFSKYTSDTDANGFLQGGVDFDARDGNQM